MAESPKPQREVEPYAAYLAMVDFIDHEIGSIHSLNELKARLVIWRKTHAWGKTTEDIGISEMAQKLGIDRRAAKRVLAGIKHNDSDGLGVEEQIKTTSKGKEFRNRTRYSWPINERVAALLQKQGGDKSTPTPWGQISPHPGGGFDPTQSITSLKVSKQPPAVAEKENRKPFSEEKTAVQEKDPIREALHLALGQNVSDTSQFKVLSEQSNRSVAAVAYALRWIADDRAKRGKPIRSAALMLTVLRENFSGWQETHHCIADALDRGEDVPLDAWESDYAEKQADAMREYEKSLLDVTQGDLGDQMQDEWYDRVTWIVQHAHKSKFTSEELKFWSRAACMEIPSKKPMAVQEAA